MIPRPPFKEKVRLNIITPPESNMSHEKPNDETNNHFNSNNSNSNSNSIHSSNSNSFSSEYSFDNDEEHVTRNDNNNNNNNNNNENKMDSQNKPRHVHFDIEEDSNVSSNTNQKSGTCIYVKKRQTKPCGNELSNTLVHGSDRYCSPCRKNAVVQYLLADEIEDNCATDECRMKVLKKEPSTVRVPGDDRYCKYCLGCPDIQSRIPQQDYSSFESNNTDMNQSIDYIETSHTSPSQTSQTNDILIPNNILNDDVSPVKQSFLKCHYFTRDNLTALAASASVTGKELQTRRLQEAELITYHVRYMVEVFLLKQPNEMASLLMWIGVSTRQSLQWEIMKEKTLRSKLITFKGEVINQLIQHLNKIDIAMNRRALTALKDTICKALAEEKKNFTNVTFTLMLDAISQLATKTPLDIFILKRIRKKKGAKKLTSTKLYDAFNQWALENDHSTYKSAVSFGKALVKCREKFWKIRDTSSQNFHDGIEIVDFDLQ